MAKLKVLIAGMAVLVIVGVATPGALVVLVSFAWPHAWTWQSLGFGRLAVLALDALAWVAWAAYLLSLLHDVLARVHPHREDVDLGSGLRARIVGYVAGLVLLLVPATALVGLGTAGAALSASNRVVATAPVTGVAAMVTGPGTVTGVATSPTALSTAVPATMTYTVTPGDCLSTIAERLYGDQGAWQEIWAANADALMNDGLRFNDPNLIYAGWQLKLPGIDPVTPTVPSVPVTASPPSVAIPSSTSPGQTTGKSAPKPVTSSPARRPVPRRRPSSITANTDDRRPPAEKNTGRVAGIGERSGHRATATAQWRAPGDPLSHWVPEAAALGLSTLAAAALARRIRRTRALSRRARGNGEALPEPSEDARDVEALANNFADAPVLDWLELANRHLSAALRAEKRLDEAPGVELVKVGPGGVELFLDVALDWAPGSFELAGGGETWRFSSDLDRRSLSGAAAGELAWLPALAAVGDDETGSYLVPLEPGRRIFVEGPGAPGVRRALVRSLSCWPWSEQVLVTEDAELVEAEVRLTGGQDDIIESRRIVFCGEPAGLMGTTRAAIALVGIATEGTNHGTINDEIGDHDVRIVTSAEGTLLEPFGIWVRPCSIDPRTAAAIDEATDPVASAPVAAPASAPRAAAGIVPAGAVEVRLLTEMPRIDGLAHPLPSDKAVRVTELIAWLGLRGEAGATSATIIDKGIAGAGSNKTVYNMVSAARHALGETGTGEPRMVGDRAKGNYWLTEDVTVDVLRFCQMAEAGAQTSDPADASALCREALELIEGEPVGNGSGRYGWWPGTWEARVGRLAVKAARRLVELAEREELDVESARWGVEQARLAAGSEEELLRVAMRLEAMAQNPAGVEREWRLARDQAEDLEPGSWPTEDTEALYNAIRRRWQRAESAPALARSGT